MKRKRSKESGRGTENAEKKGTERGTEKKRAPVDQLWERSREEQKETYSRAEYRKPEGMHGKPGRRKGGKLRKRKRR